MQKIRVLTVTDLHLLTSLYEQLAAAVAEHRPDVVACIGDFLDEEAPTRRQVPRLSAPEAARVLSALPCDLVITRGNHEQEIWYQFQDEWDSIGKPLHALHGTYACFGPLVVVGFPCWLGDDEAYSQGRPLRQYNPESWLPSLLKHTGPAGRTLWLIHEPPSLDIASYEAYEPDWREAIERYQPVVTVSGHDHHTPIQTGRWQTKIGTTVSINAGQRVHPPGKLSFCLLDFEFPSDAPSLPTKFVSRRFS